MSCRQVMCHYTSPSCVVTVSWCSPKLSYTTEPPSARFFQPHKQLIIPKDMGHLRNSFSSQCPSYHMVNLPVPSPALNMLQLLMISVNHFDEPSFSQMARHESNKQLWALQQLTHRVTSIWGSWVQLKGWPSTWQLNSWSQCIGNMVIKLPTL